jgi:hypothetical protein
VTPTQQPFWYDLSPETLARGASDDSPVLPGAEAPGNAATPAVAPKAAGLRGIEDGECRNS